MKKQNKSKKGFTLVEVMLSIAIIVMISGLFVTLIYAVKNSFYRTYNYDDATDYAALYSQALENQILRDAQASRGGSILYRIQGSESEFYRIVNGAGGTSQPMFNLTQMHNKDGNCKWLIYLDKCCYHKDSHILEYQLVLVDNYYNPGDEILRYDGELWIPVHTSDQGVQTEVFIAIPGKNSVSSSNGNTYASTVLDLYTGDAAKTCMKTMSDQYSPGY